MAIDVSGKPAGPLVNRVREKAEMLGSGGVRVHELPAGFARHLTGQGVRLPDLRCSGRSLAQATAVTRAP